MLQTPDGVESVKVVLSFIHTEDAPVKVLTAGSGLIVIVVATLEVHDKAVIE